jgi:hypothetical protein
VLGTPVAVEFSAKVRAATTSGKIRFETTGFTRGEDLCTVTFERAGGARVTRTVRCPFERADLVDYNGEAATDPRIAVLSAERGGWFAVLNPMRGVFQKFSDGLEPVHVAPRL